MNSRNYNPSNNLYQPSNLPHAASGTAVGPVPHAQYGAVPPVQTGQLDLPSCLENGHNTTKTSVGTNTTGFGTLTGFQSGQINISEGNKGRDPNFEKYKSNAYPQTTGLVDPCYGEPSYPETPDPEVQPDGYSISGLPDNLTEGCTVTQEELEHTCMYHSILDKLDEDENRLLDEIERINNLRESVDDPTIQKVLELLEYING